MEEKCSYRTDDCINKVNIVEHEGTELKFDAFASYTNAWLEKVINHNNNPKTKYKKEQFSFVDCMCSSGLYYNKKTSKFVDGTVIRVMKIFIKLANKYPMYDFYLYFNDYDKQYYSCLQCLKRNLLKNKPINLSVEITMLDKNDFIYQLSINDLFKRRTNKSLVIYDPYDVDFDWNHLSKLLKFDSDFIFTHFLQNDFKRAVHTVKDKTKIAKYEQSYQMGFDELSEKFDKFIGELNERENAIYRSELLRDLFTELIHKYSNKKYSCYCPVFNSKAPVYDIVCLSNSSVALGVLKNAMYKLYKNKKADKVKKSKPEQLTLFVDEKTDVGIRNANVSEFEFHYNKVEILKKFKSIFKGKTVTKVEMEKILNEDPYLPSTGIFKDIIMPNWPYETPSQTGGFYKFKEDD
ncbi:three-Cys-motif partner protein TcmP [Breznakia pachnodae]|uniref:Three-Cys-motif partner protein n=1 Tax=Breznakia pachnodae TaxID=265178 RepID=A0ABU0E8T1_9FIRM|nr:three-Cys-motif partner protein TcmP [Breznakia pachnodae]MDQ0363251.1 three-Cys-motif partner protein [Breznakia pachnodae]